MPDSKENKLGKDKITPEEKLLKIIENPGMQRPKMSILTKINKVKIDAFVLRVKAFRFDRSLIKKLNLRIATKTLAVCCVLITIILIFDFLIAAGSISRRLEKTLQLTNTSIAEEKKTALPILNLEEVITQTKRRNMFTFLLATAEAQAGENQTRASKIPNLKLVGILWSSSPQVMIENTGDQRTYLLSQGEQVEQVTIKKIFRDKVVLELEGQEQELR